MAADGALVLLAENPHPSGALVAHGMITVADGENFHVFEAHHAGVVVVARIALQGLRLDSSVISGGVGHSGFGTAVERRPGRRSRFSVLHFTRDFAVNGGGEFTCCHGHLKMYV